MTKGMSLGTALERSRVLVVDDDDLVASAFCRMLRATGATVDRAADGASALEAIERESYDVVLSDLSMPGMSGLDMVRAIREHDLDLPVIFVTGAPHLESAAVAVELGAFRYLAKPVEADVLRAVVGEAARLRRLTRDRTGWIDRAALEERFRAGLAGLRLVFQPIVSVRTREAIGHEALMRSSEPSFPSPLALLEVAESLGGLHQLGRRVRSIAAAQLAESPATGQLFVNLHPADLADPELYELSSPLARHARRVVLELTERASLESVPDVEQRLRSLRELGYRVAVDDLGAGYAGLSYFARVRPEIVKIDMSLVRGVDTDSVRREVVSSLTLLARGLDMEVVAEGIETESERDTLVDLGVSYVQGYGLARPGPPFPTVTWA